MDKFEMPPPITSLFGRDVRKGISQDEFVIIDGRVMLPQESVAKFFDMSVRDVTLAVPFIQKRARSTLGIVRRDGKFYFSTGESMIEMHSVSPYRNAETDFSFFYRLFSETQEDLVTNKLYYEPDRTPPKKTSDGVLGCMFLLLIIVIFYYFVTSL